MLSFGKQLDLDQSARYGRK